MSSSSLCSVLSLGLISLRLMTLLPIIAYCSTHNLTLFLTKNLEKLLRTVYTHTCQAYIGSIVSVSASAALSIPPPRPDPQKSYRYRHIPHHPSSPPFPPL